MQQQRPPQRTGNIIFLSTVCTTTEITTNEWKHNFSNGLCPQNLPVNMHQQTPQTNSKQSCNLKKPKLKGSLQIRDGFLHTINATHNQCHKTFLKTDWEALGNFWQPLDKAKILLFQRIIPKNVISIRRWLEVCKEFCELLVNQDKFIKHNSQSPKFCFTLQYNSYIR